MLRKFAVPALALLALPAIASAQFEAGDYDFTLRADGNAPREGRGGFVGVQAQAGYFMTKELEVGVRQTVTYLQNDESTPNTDRIAWGGQTGAVAAFHFDLGALQPYIAMIGGYDYPANTDGNLFVAPELGAKYFVNGTTYLFGALTYIYETGRPTDSYWQFGAGVGFRF